MKKILSWMTLSLALLLLGGCGSSNAGAPEGTTQNTASDATETQGEVEIDAAEYVKLGKYKGLTIESEPVEVTDEDVDEEVSYLAEEYLEYQKIDRKKVKKGDYANIDYSCIIDGKKNEEYSDSDIDIYVGDGEIQSYFGEVEDDVDIESKIIGAKVGKTISVDVTFSKDEDESIAGKDGTLKITINAIEKEVIPEVDDEFIKENTEYDTLKEYREKTKADLEETRESEAKSANREALMEKIAENSTQIKDFTQEQIAQQTEILKAQNEEYASMFGMSVDDLVEEVYEMSMEKYAISSLKWQCVQDLLLQAEKIKITDKEYDAQIKEMAEADGFESEEEYLEYYSEEEIRKEIQYNKLMDTLLGYTTIKEK